MSDKPKVLVSAFMRCNIFHKGHMLLVKRVEELAKQHHGDAAIFLSHTQNKKNPLPYLEKAKLMNKWTHGVVKLDPENKVKQPGNILHYANERGYDEVYLVCGADRFPDYQKSFVDFANSRDYFKFKKVGVLSRGGRDPDEDGEEASMSGTAMRKYVADGDYEDFRKSLPSEASDADAELVWKLAKKGLGLTEGLLSFKEYILEQTINQPKIRKISSDWYRISIETDKFDITTKAVDIIKNKFKEWSVCDGEPEIGEKVDDLRRYEFASLKIAKIFATDLANAIIHEKPYPRKSDDKYLE